MVQGKMVLMKGVQTRNIYKLLGINFSDGCNNLIVPKDNSGEDKILIVTIDKTTQWHKRLGNIGEKCLRSLHGKGIVEGIYGFSLDFGLCEHCIYGKQNKVRFPFSCTIGK